MLFELFYSLLRHALRRERGFGGADAGAAMSSVPPSDVAYRMLRLEQQLESYQRLHAEELAAIRRALEELKNQVLSLDAHKETSADEEFAKG